MQRASEDRNQATIFSAEEPSIAEFKTDTSWLKCQMRTESCIVNLFHKGEL
jgi:hypothetical protein